MSTKYKGDVDCTDADGNPYVLRLSTAQWVEIQAQADKLDGRAWQLLIFHHALRNGADSQKNMTRTQAGELLDDIGYLAADELIQATRFGVNSKRANDDLKRKHEAAVKDASLAFAAKVSALKRGVDDEALLAAIDLVAAKVTEGLTPEGSANPPAATETTPSS